MNVEPTAEEQCAAEERRDPDWSRRGREADHPTKIPPLGWKDIASRVRHELAADNVGLAAAGVAFYGLLGVFPGLAFAVSSYGLWGDPAALIDRLDRLVVVPVEARDVLVGRLVETAAADDQAGWGLVGALLIGLWSSSKATAAMIRALNIVYEEGERRSFIRRTVLSLILTFIGLVVGLLGLLVVLGVPALLTFVGLGVAERIAVLVVPWIVLASCLTLALGLLYRFAPCRRDAKLVWITPGALLAMVVWLAGSIGFSFYISRFGRYDEIYGSLGAVVILLMWLYLSAYAVLLGAEINAEIEHQTARDSTVGPDRPIGKRGAHMADTLGKKRS